MSLGRAWALALLAIPVVLLWLRLRARRPREAEASSLLVWEKVSSSDTPPTRPRPPIAAWLEALGAALLVIGIADPATGGVAPKPTEVPPPKSGGFNAGITAASGAPLPDGRWRLYLAVEAHGAPGPVEGVLRIGESRESITLAPGKPLDVVRELASVPEEARVEFAGDVFVEDDVIQMQAEGASAVTGGVDGTFAHDDPVLKAVRSAGATIERTHGGGMYDRDGIKMGSGDRFVQVAYRGEDSESIVRGETVTTADHVLSRDVRVDPTCTLGRRLEMQPGGTPILIDDVGPLVVLHETSTWPGAPIVPVVVLGFRPGGTWVERDPSFVVFAKNLVEYVAGGPARIEAKGVLDSKRTREAADGGKPADAPPPAAPKRNSHAFVLLLAGAGALAAAWWATR